MYQGVTLMSHNRTELPTHRVQGRKDDPHRQPQRPLFNVALVMLVGLVALGSLLPSLGPVQAAPSKIGFLEAGSETPTATPGPVVVYEAEDGTLNGTEVQSSRPGFSGSGYVGSFDLGSDSVAVTVTAPSAGLYSVGVRYAGPFGYKENDLYVNGDLQATLKFPAIDTFTDLPPVSVWLNEGQNTVEIRYSWGWIEVDAFKVAPAPPRPALDVPNTLVNPNASEGARRLMTYLTDTYGKQILAGQDTLNQAQWLEQKTGKNPAVLGVDLIDYSPSRLDHGVDEPHTVEDAIQWWEAGGIVTVYWHWNAPSGLYDVPGKEWWRGFYTDATSFDLAAALADPCSNDYLLLLRDIDQIAVQLKRLQDAGVPVLWRPLHEAEGGWFWWGAKGPAAATQLYRLMYDRLTNYHHLNNLIWVWTAYDSPNSLQWYPGEQYVDVIGADIYLPKGSHSPSLAMFDNLVSMYGGHKLVTMSENGAMPDADLLQDQRVGWSWMMTWSGFNTDPQQNTVEFQQWFYQHPYVVTRDELPDLKTYPTSPATATPTLPVTSTPTSTRTATPTRTPTSTPTATPDATAVPLQYVEAENGVLNGTAVESSQAGFSGTGYVSSFDNDNDSVQVTVTVPTSGFYDLTIRYASPYGYKKNNLIVNSTSYGEIEFPETQAFTDLLPIKVSLNAGSNTITVSKSWGWFFLDAFKLEGGAATPTPTPTSDATSTPTGTLTATPTATPTRTLVATPVKPGACLATGTPTETATGTPPTNTPTGTLVSTPTETATGTPPTNTPTGTPTTTPTTVPVTKYRVFLPFLRR
jgi:mannan endo-1,4-beta-mannosidase